MEEPMDTRQITEPTTTKTAITSLKKQTPMKTARDVRRELVQKMRGPHPVVWAFEPMPEALENERKFRDLIEVWKSPEQKVIPTTVLSAFDTAWPLRVSREVRKKLMDHSRQKLEKILKNAGMAAAVVRALPSDSLSMRKMAEILAKFARREKAEVLIVGSRASHRSEVTGIGSFVEALIAISRVPVMVVSENAEVPEKISKIFFPTDLSPGSQRLFAQVIRLARNWDAEIILYHHFDLQMGPLMMGPEGIGMDTRWLNQMWDDQKKLTEDTGRKWERNAIKNGVRCTFVADHEFGALADRMLAIAKKASSDLMVVGIKRGPLSQVIFGKVVRHLFAKCPSPVLVLRAQRSN
jgi:nucleotide-binding universal stress UspA family protein